jgi:hypothetical protein
MGSPISPKRPVAASDRDLADPMPELLGWPFPVFAYLWSSLCRVAIVARHQAMIDAGKHPEA